MKFSIALLVLLTFFLKVFSQNDESIKPSKYKRVSQAFGYLLGQEFTLEKIQDKFPETKMKVKMASLEFNSNFGLAKTNIIIYLKEIYGNDYLKLENSITKEIEKILNLQQLTKDDSENFILEVQNRSKGNITTPVLETLLSFQYKDRPELELSTGSFYTFKTKGHSKSKNTDWQVNIPKSWNQKEGIRPNIIKKFTSEYGDGLETVTLMVKDLPKNYEPSQKELLDFFPENGLKKTVPTGAKFISGKRVTLDNNIGGMLEIEQKMERVDISLKLRILQFSFYKKSKMYILQCGVGGKEDEDLNNRLQKFLPLYRLIANSLVVNDQY